MDEMVLIGGLFTDALWAQIKPLLPATPRRHRHPGRKRLDDRRVLN